MFCLSVNEALKRPPPLYNHISLVVFFPPFFSPNGQITSGHIATTGGMQLGKRIYTSEKNKSEGEKAAVFVIVNTHRVHTVGSSER
jgi:hypothetical protein